MAGVWVFNLFTDEEIGFRKVKSGLFVKSKNKRLQPAQTRPRSSKMQGFPSKSYRISNFGRRPISCDLRTSLMKSKFPGALIKRTHPLSLRTPWGLNKPYPGTLLLRALEYPLPIHCCGLCVDSQSLCGPLD